MLNRRTFFLSLAALGALPIRSVCAATPVFYRNAGCGCCHAWAERMPEAGLPVSLEDSEDLAALSARYGIPKGLEGCHVGRIDRYMISGHVPPEDIKRLLAEKPDGLGLLVPAMPFGSPGMEMNGQVEPYDILLLGRDGKTTVFASHA